VVVLAVTREVVMPTAATFVPPGVPSLAAKPPANVKNGNRRA
jgi:hypothetical protein